MLVLGVEVGEFLHQHLDRPAAVRRLISKAPAVRRGTQVFRKYIAPRLDGVRGCVIGQRVKLHAGVPKPHRDVVGPEHLDGTGVGEPAGDAIDLPGQHRRHVGAERDNLHVFLGDLVFCQ